jgi:polyisoprenoid-binding protein YceI
MKPLLLTMVAVLSATLIFSQNSYQLDKNHTSVGFSATHFGISQVEGKFKIIEASIKASKEDFTDAAIEMTCEISSINTDVDMRDKDLKSDKWFNAEKYPKLTFKSTAFKKQDGKNYKLEGTITIHGITKPIVLDVVYNGKELNPMTKKSSVGFTITGKLNRLDFGVGAGTITAIVGNEIQLRANAEFIVTPLLSENDDED